MWDINDQSFRYIIGRNEYMSLSLCISNHNDVLVSGDSDCNIRIWYLNN